MPIQATIKYWNNKNMGFGHVAIEIADPTNSQKKFYISWATGNSLANDIQAHGMLQPVDIQLPAIPGSFIDFENSLKDSAYYLPDRIITAMNTGVFATYTDEINVYRNQYNVATNNCAHCVQSILKMAGYPSSIFFHFTPFSAANKACLIGQIVWRKQRMAVLHDETLQPNEKIQKLIQLSIEALKLDPSQLIYEEISTQFNKTSADLKLLSTFLAKNPDLRETSDVKEILKMLLVCQLPTTIKELTQCLNLIDPKIRYKAQIELAIDELREHSKNKLIGSAEEKAVKKLIAILQANQAAYFEQKTIDKKTFKKNCATAIIEAKQTLAQGRWSRLLWKLALIINKGADRFVIADKISNAMGSHFFRQKSQRTLLKNHPDMGKSLKTSR